MKNRSVAGDRQHSPGALRRRPSHRRRRAWAQDTDRTARHRHRHRRPADLAADADSHHHRGRHARADRADASTPPTARTRSSTCPACWCASATSATTTTPSCPAAPRAPATARARRSMPTASCCRTTWATASAAYLRAALGPGDARGDRARRRDVRPVLGRLSGQLGRRGGRLRDAHADAVRGARQGSATSSQPFELYGTHRPSAPGRPAPRSAASSGDWSWWIDVNRTDSQGQPLTFATGCVSVGHRRRAGTPVTGAVLGLNTDEPRRWYLVGGSTSTTPMQDHAKLKLAYDISPTVRATYTLGVWQNTSERQRRQLPAQRAPASRSTSGRVNIDGPHATASTRRAPTSR